MLAEVAGLFFRLGCIGFGGPPAHLALMEEQCIKQRQWVTPEQFSEGLAVCNLLPGPTSTQMAIWLGYARAGTAGAILAGVCFIIPAFALLLGLTWAYFRYHTLPGMKGLFAGLTPAVVAIILATCWRLGKTAIKDWLAALVGLAALALTWRGIEVAFTLLGAGTLGLLRSRFQPPPSASPKPPPEPNPPAQAPPSETEDPKSKKSNLLPPLLLLGVDAKLLQLAGMFLKVGALLFGGGLVIIPFLRHEVVDVRQWMTLQEFTDGVALGQVTPGPVVITATFIGYKVADWPGAIVATLAIFLPSFVFILFAAPQLAKIRKYAPAQAFLKGTAPAVVGAILSACIPMIQNTLATTLPFRLWLPATLLLLNLFALIRTKIGTPWLIVASGLVGLLLAHS